MLSCVQDALFTPHKGRSAPNSLEEARAEQGQASQTATLKAAAAAMVPKRVWASCILHSLNPRHRCWSCTALQSASHQHYLPAVMPPPCDTRLPDCFSFAIVLERMDTAWHSAQQAMLAPCYMRQNSSHCTPQSKVNISCKLESVSARCNSLLTLAAFPANYKSHASLQTLNGSYTGQHSACGPFMFCISHASHMMLCNPCRVG